MSEFGRPAPQEISPDALMAQLRERGAERRDPVGFRFIEALARRAQQYGGDTRRILDGKLAHALNECAARIAHAGGEAVQPDIQSARGPLAELLEDIEARAKAERLGAQPRPEAANPRPHVELKSLRHSRDTWSKLSAEHQLAQALEQAPENAGPLNSHRLMLESLKAMHAISPAYLKRFLSYVDALLWLDTANGAPHPLARSAVRAEREGKAKGERVARRG